MEDLGFSPSDAKRVRQRIARRARVVTEPVSQHQVPDDPKDSPILRAALEAGADYLVSNDLHLLELKQYESVRMLSLTEYLNVLAVEGYLE